MPTLQELHQQSYADMPFDDFAKRLHEKHYSDMPFGDFMAKAGGQANPIAQGDWSGLRSRIDQAESLARGQGVSDEKALAELRAQIAREQGKLYGTANAGKASGGLVGEGIGRALDGFSIGLPRLAEAYLPGFLGGQSELPGSEAHEFIKAADEGRAERNPGTAMAGNIAGILGQAASLPVATGGLAARLGAGALQSALLGGAETAVRTRGDLGETAQSLAVGAGAGAVGGTLGEGMVAMGRKLLDPIKGLARSGAPDEQAAARVLLAAKNERVTPATILTRADELGGNFMLADALGASGESLVRTAGNVSPAARSTIEGAYQGRTAGQTNRLVDELMAAGNLTERRTVSELSEAAAAAAKPKIDSAYNQARAAGVDMPIEPFDALASSPMFREALARATDQTADRAAAFGGDQGSRFSVYDAARQILANQGFKDGDDVAKALARKTNATIDENLPEAYGARSLAADLKRRQEALELGASGFGKRAEGSFPREIAARGLPPRPEVAQGYAAAAIEELGKRSAGTNAVDQLTGSQNALEALKAALGGNAAKVLKQADAERHFMSSSKAVLGGSDTARKLTEIQLAGIGAGAGSGAGYLAGYDPYTSAGLGAALLAGKRAAGRLTEARRTANEAKVAPTIAAILTGQTMPKLPRGETKQRAFVEELLRLSAKAGALGAAQ